LINDEKFLERFKSFLLEDDKKNFELDIIKAAHKYSTKREFEIIKTANTSFPEISQIEKRLRSDIEQYTKFRAISLLNNETDFFGALCLIEQLRYEIRWSQTPRIPKTSVLGHSMYVAVLSFFLSRELNACPKRLVNNFYAALFHDLPESVTRDIISPVKRATSELPLVIKSIEKEVCESELYPKFPIEIIDELKYLIGDVNGLSDEFCNRYMSIAKRKNSKMTIKIKSMMNIIKMNIHLLMVACLKFVMKLLRIWKPISQLNME
jgi:putative hydrolase of HD superfamily